MVVKIVGDPSFGFRLELPPGIENTTAIAENGIRRSNELYLHHLDLLHRNPVFAGRDINLWWFHPATARFDSFWDVSYAYFVCAQLRIVLEKRRTTVVSEVKLPQEVRLAIREICNEFGIGFEQLASGTEGRGSRVKWTSRLKGIWGTIGMLYSVAISGLIQPVVVMIDFVRLKTVFKNVRYWFIWYESAAHNTKYRGIPRILTDKGCRVGYATGGTQKVKVSRTGNTPFFFYYHLSILRKVMIWTQAKGVIRRLTAYCTELLEKTSDPEQRYLLRKLKLISRLEIASRMVDFESCRSFARKVKRSVWFNSQPLTLPSSQSYTAAVRSEKHFMVSIAPHYYSSTRLSNLFTPEELTQTNVPDLYIVFDKLSKNVLTKHNGIHENQIAVANPWNISNRDGLSSSDGVFKVFVPLQRASENSFLISTITRALAPIQDIHAVFKAHPLHPLQEGLEPYVMGKVSCSLEQEDSDLYKLASSCDICISAYSTAAFPAIASAKPVVWVPFASLNSVFSIDFYERVGVKAYNEHELFQAVNNLKTSVEYYRSNALHSARFAQEVFCNNHEAFELDKIDSLLETFFLNPS